MVTVQMPEAPRGRAKRPGRGRVGVGSKLKSRDNVVPIMPAPPCACRMQSFVIKKNKKSYLLREVVSINKVG